jgi:hypothetical protein
VTKGVDGARARLSVLSISWLLIELPAKTGVDEVEVEVGFGLKSNLGKKLVEFGSRIFLFLDTDFIFMDGAILCNALALARRAGRSRSLVGLLAGATLLRSGLARDTSEGGSAGANDLLYSVDAFFEGTRCRSVFFGAS